MKNAFTTGAFEALDHKEMMTVDGGCRSLATVAAAVVAVKVAVTVAKVAVKTARK